MLIENTEAFKEWLTKQLEPICDADPMALAKYVVALVKKDKPEAELADNCNDQLEVFLQDKTADFTKSLFAALNSGSYLPGAEVKKESQEEKPDKQETEHLKEVKQEPKELKEQENKDEHRERRRKTPEREDRGDRRRSPLRERRSPPHSPSLRDRRSPPPRRSVQERLGGRRGDDRRGGRRPDDRAARRPGPYWPDRDRRRFDRDDAPPRDRRDLRRRSLSPRRRTPPNRDGDQGHRSPTKDANANKSPRAEGEKDVEGMEQGDSNKDASSASTKQDKPRARSPSDHLSSRDRSDRELRSLSRRRSRSPGRSRPRSASSRRSRSRSWTPRSRSRSRSRSFPRRRSRSRSRDRDRDRYNPIPSRRQRCRDFEEKGYCMQGDFCPYDHGLDPVVVEDINLPVPLPYNPGAPPPVLPPPGASHLGPPPGMPMAGPPPVPSMPPRGPPPHMPPHDMRFPPPPLGQPMMGPPAETYNPEAPSLAGPPPTAQPPFWRPPGPGAPPGVPPGVPPPESGAPPVPYSQAPLMAPRRDLVTVQTVQPAAPPMGDQRHVIQTNRPPPFINNGGQHQHHQHYGRGRGRGGYNRSMGPRPDITNTTLEVRKIPQDMNNIAKLNEHFAKFGTLVNVQIAFDGDREAALVSFASNKEASAAYRSSDPVFNNRFIKVFWHNKEAAAAAAGAAGSASPSASTSAAPSSAPASKEIPPPEKLSLNNAQKRQEEKEKVVVNALKSGLITKTLYNTQVIKNKMAAISANKAADPQRKKEDALKKKVEIQRQKQELLKKLLEEQKGLLDRMDKNKTTMSADEKKTILSTIKSLANHIEKLRKEINSYQANQPKQPVVVKTKQEAQKQILDTELELMAKEGAPGVETVQLKKRLADLRREANYLGLSSHGRGRGRGRGFAARGRGAMRGRTSLCVDRRPRCLLVSGHEDHEKEDLTKHFAYFGELESVEFLGDGDMLVTYKTRSDAEQAYRSASRYKKLTLSMAWYKPPPAAPPSGADTDQAAKPGPSEEQIKKELAAADNSEDDDDDYANLDEDILLGDMDDDDSLEDGDRSWRR